MGRPVVARGPPVRPAVCRRPRERARQARWGPAAPRARRTPSPRRLPATAGAPRRQGLAPRVGKRRVGDGARRRVYGGAGGAGPTVRRRAPASRHHGRAVPRHRRCRRRPPTLGGAFQREGGRQDVCEGCGAGRRAGPPRRTRQYGAGAASASMRTPPSVVEDSAAVLRERGRGPRHGRPDPTRGRTQDAPGRLQPTPAAGTPARARAGQRWRRGRRGRCVRAAARCAPGASALSSRVRRSPQC